jgi:hypothetical protein
MNRSFGWGTVILIAVAAAWFGTARQSIPDGASSAAQTSLPPATGAKKPVGKGKLDSRIGCQPLEDALQTFFLVDGEKIKAPDDCFEDKNNLSDRKPEDWVRASKARYMIASLPDPIHTHMAAIFDQMMESIEHAAQQEGFTYDSSWLPWRDADQTYTFLDDNLAATKLRKAQEEQPGVLLFRNSSGNNSDPYTGALVVFVVGEQTTAGINKKQFENAAAWVRELNPYFDSQPLSILGPYSSGSFASLADVLNRPGISPSMTKPLRIVSGSTSSLSAIDAFDKAMTGKLEWGKVITFAENTQLEIGRYLRLLNNEGYDPGHVAVVSEDETTFGRDPSELDCGPDPKSQSSVNCPQQTAPYKPGLNLRYPRDIADLRSAYQEQGLMSAQGNKAEFANRQRLLSQDLDEKAEEADDTIKTYSGIQADLSDEGELLQVVTQLQVHQIQFVLLISSNPLDQIFLARFLRAADPSVRVVIVASNQSLFREQGANGLRGVLTLSPYPLSPVVKEWTTDSSLKDEQIFTSDSAQGLFYATQLLLEAKTAVVDQQVPFLPEYAAPLWIEPRAEVRVPPTWLAVISAGRPWPVAALDESTLSNSLSRVPGSGDPCSEPRDPAVLLQTPQCHSTLTKRQPGSGHSSVSQSEVPMEFPLAVLVCILWAAFHASLRIKASVVLTPRCRAYFSLTRNWQHALILNLSWACIGVAAISLAWFSRDASLIARNWNWFWLPLPLLAFGCAVFPIFDWILSGEYPRGIYGVIPAFISLGITVAFYPGLMIYLPGRQEATTIPEQWRGLNLLSGVSPAVPFVLLAAGAYLWCFWNLKGLALFNCDEPQLPTEDDLRLGTSGDSEKTPSAACRSYSTPRERAGRLRMFATEAYLKGRDWGLVFNLRAASISLIILSLLIALVLLLNIRIRELGDSRYGYIFECALLIALVVMLTDALKSYKLWQSLHELLGFLDRVPLRRMMRSIGDFSWDSVWAIGGAVLQLRYQMLSRQIESFHHFQNVWNEQNRRDAEIPNSEEINKAIENLGQEVQCKFGPWFSKHYGQSGKIDLSFAFDLQKSIAALTAALFTHLLLPAWKNESDSLILHDAKGNHGDTHDAGVQDSGAQSKSILVRTAEEFVCLNYLAFIQNMMGRIRSLIIGTAVLFLAATIACSSYPFDPQPTLSFTFSILFILLAGTVILIYAQAHRDATLSNITNTTPGSLGGDFFLKVLQFVLGPAIGLISVLYPSISNTLFTLMQPGQFK